MDLLNEILAESIREYHSEVQPFHPVADLSELLKVLETVKDWALTTRYVGVTNECLQAELAKRGHRVTIVGEEV
jgi:hypothetical protein